MEQQFVKTHYVEMNLGDVLEQLGEDATKSILSSFSCPMNKDIEDFIKHKAIEFSKRSQGIYDETRQEYTVSAPLIAQLVKNY